MSIHVIALIMFVLLFLLIFLRVPVSFALCFSVIPILVIESRVTTVMLLQRMMTQYGSFIMLAIPFFLLAANIMNESGVTNRLIRFSKSIVGFLPGALGHVNVLVSMLFAGISGSSNADAAGIGSILIPAMIEDGYDKRFSVAVTACSAVMGVIIPPSITMVIWGGVMNTSVSGLFLAGFIPGAMIAISQMILVYIYAIKKKHHSMVVKFNLKEFLNSFKQAILALFTPIIIIGGIVGGFVTPTEASLIAVLYALILGLILYKTLPKNKISAILLQTGKFAAIILFAVGAASIYGWVLAYFKIPTLLVNTISAITESQVILLLIIVGTFLLVGTFLDAIPAIVIFAPLLRPIAEHAGIHPLHFGIVGIMSLAFGLITPPYGLCLLIASDIAGINCMEAIKEVGAFLLVMLIVLLVIILIPSVSLYLPKLFLPDLF